MIGEYVGEQEAEELTRRMSLIRLLLGGDAEDDPASLATKAAKSERRARDRMGCVIDKPFALAGAEPEPEGPRRSATGKRLNKPWDPRRGRMP